MKRWMERLLDTARLWWVTHMLEPLPRRPACWRVRYTRESSGRHVIETIRNDETWSRGAATTMRLAWRIAHLNARTRRLNERASDLL